VSSWDATYRRLRAQYVRNGAGRIERTERALSSVGEDPTNSTALTDLHREFHGFAGSGRIYGFAEVSAVGRDAERDVAALMATEAPPSLVDVERLRGRLDELRRLFAEAAEGLEASDALS
jgi:hypothetical protein